MPDLTYSPEWTPGEEVSALDDHLASNLYEAPDLRGHLAKSSLAKLKTLLQWPSPGLPRVLRSSGPAGPKTAGWASALAEHQSPEESKGVPAPPRPSDSASGWGRDTNLLAPVAENAGHSPHSEGFTSTGQPGAAPGSRHRSQARAPPGTPRALSAQAGPGDAPRSGARETVLPRNRLRSPFAGLEAWPPTSAGSPPHTMARSVTALSTSHSILPSSHH